jgi:ABC-type uncharacterized transport system substrate-binding protein
VRSPSGFDGAFAVLIRERVDAMTATENPLNVEHKDSIVSFATKNRLPTVFGERVFVDAGGLMSYGMSFADLLRRLATCMDKILKGAKPADLPVEQPTIFELVINMKTAKAVVNLTNPVYGPVLRASEEPARALGLQLVVISVQSAEDFEPSIQAARKRVGGLIVQRDSVLFTNRPRLLAQVAANRLPAIYGAREFTENGGLMSYGPDLADMYRRAAYLIDQILRGAKPSELPVEQATKFELVINLKTAKALGLTVPQTLLQRADQVIQ